MNVKELLDRYDGKPIGKNQLSNFEQSAMGFFHDRNYVENPHIQMTLQLDISEAESVYRKVFAKEPNASLTAYLTWRLLKTLNNYPTLHYRHLDGQWYKFDNLPLFFNVALKDSAKLKDIVIENASKMAWSEFCDSYRKSINNAIDSKTSFVPNHLYNIATVICNLPNLSFTHFSVHQLKAWHGRPVFYFGRRYNQGEKLFIPLFIQLDHSNGDPILIDAVLSEFRLRFGSLR